MAAFGPQAPFPVECRSAPDSRAAAQCERCACRKCRAGHPPARCPAHHANPFCSSEPMHRRMSTSIRRVFSLPVRTAHNCANQVWDAFFTAHRATLAATCLLPPSTLRTARKLGGHIIEMEAGVIPAEGAGPFPPAVAIHERAIGDLMHRAAARLLRDMAAMRRCSGLGSRPHRHGKHCETADCKRGQLSRRSHCPPLRLPLNE